MSSEVSPSARGRVAKVLGASAIALSSSRVREQVGAYSTSVIRQALAHLKQEGSARRHGTTRVPMYTITEFGRQQYLGEQAPALADATTWIDRRDGWTGTRVDNLRLLCAQGYSYSDIAAKLGGGLTKNACIGKAGRLGITNHKLNDMETNAMRRPRKARTKAKPKMVKRVQSVLTSAPAVEVYAEPLTELLPPEAIPIEQRKQLLDLEPNDCRFPYGTPGKPDFFFCGGDAVSFQPYCPFHCRIAFNGVGRPRATGTSTFERNRQSFGSR